MALGTVTPVRNVDVVGNLRVSVTDVQPTSGANYTTGGSPLTAAQLGLRQILFAIASVKTVAANGPAEVYYDWVNGLLICFTGVAQVASNVDLSGSLVNVVAFGF